MSRKSRHKSSTPKDKVMPDQTEDLAAEGSTSSEAAGSDEAADVFADSADPEPDTFGDMELEMVDPLDAMEMERDALQEKWLRVVAEMDNLRKRSRRELADSRRLAQADILRPILGVMDNFERALLSLHENKEQADFERFLEGVDLIFQNFQSVLSDLGAQPMDVLGQEFDPVFHEAVGQLPREGVESGQVIEVIQNGFLFEDQVLRPARVIISA